MVLGDGTVERARAYWRGWEAEGAGPDAVSIVTIGADRFTRIPEWLRPTLDVDALTDLASIVAALGDHVEHVVGEARLAYGDETTLRLVAFGDASAVDDDDPRLVALERASDPGEWREASADEPCASRVGVESGGALLAVASLRIWDDQIGQVGVFTAADARGRGLAQKVGSAVINEAIARGCVPQWRSRLGNEASVRVADKLGFVALGRQAFVRVKVAAES